LSDELEERLNAYQKKLQEVATKMKEIEDDENMPSDLKIELMTKLLEEVNNDQKKE
jgi:hypothetical protein